MEEKATEKQLKFMKQLGIGFYPNTTKADARKWIETKLNENGDAKPVKLELTYPSDEELGIEANPKGELYNPKKDNGFHLTPENINLGAIDMTLKARYHPQDDKKEFMTAFKFMKRIIVTGE